MSKLSRQNIRGVKRRGPDEKESEQEGREAELRRKLHHALRELRKVVKKARSFEVQKTLKKLKDARRQDPESSTTKDLGAQLEMLKHLSCDQLAHSALMTKLKKDKALSANPLIQVISVELSSDLVSPGAPGTPTAKVQSRILSSKLLASEVVSTVETLRTFLHPFVGLEGIETATDNPYASPIISKKRKVGTGHEKEVSPSNDNFMSAHDDGSDGEYENKNGDDAITEMDHGWESGTVGASSRTGSPAAGLVDDRDSGSDDSNGRSGDESGFASENPQGSESQPHGSKDQSEFLPSLSVGFARGDSDSEFSDDETGSVGAIKKNRRGQRARRAIWEKKFGRNANHIKKRQEQESVHRSRRNLPDSIRVNRRSGKANSYPWSHRTPSQSRPPIHSHKQVQRPVLAGSRGANNSGSTTRRSEGTERRGGRRENQGERRLHPSWEAKKKQQAIGIVPSQGTKITFSES